jgi:hypothetical protein
MTNWNFQYRAFALADPTNVRQKLDAAKELRRREQKVTDTYVVGTSDVAVRVRDSQIKVKGPKRHVDSVVDEVQDQRYFFPVDSTVITGAIGVPEQTTTGLLGLGRKTVRTQLKSLADLTQFAGGLQNVCVTNVLKNSHKYEGDGLEVEVTEAKLNGSTFYTVCVASDRVTAVHDALSKFGILSIAGSERMEYAEALRKYTR